MYSCTLLCYCFTRIERVKIKELHSQAKVIGTVVTFLGALLMTIYKGPIVNLIWTPKTSHFGGNGVASDKHWVLGTVCVLIGCVAWSCFYILQVISSLNNYKVKQKTYCILFYFLFLKRVRPTLLEAMLFKINLDNKKKIYLIL